MLVSESNMDSAQGDRNIDHKDSHIDATVRKDHIHDIYILGNKPVDDTISSSSSSTSTDSSEGDFFQLDASELNRMVAESDILSAQHGGSAQLASEFGTPNGEAVGISLPNKHGALGDFDGISAGSQLPMRRHFSPEVYVSSLGANIRRVETIQSPPVQTMIRYDVPDPNRIPSSVFARSKSTKLMEWSVAYNESLFSIQMGNSSFSRDHVILLGKSGELGSTLPFSPFHNSNPSLPVASPDNVDILATPNPVLTVPSPDPITPVASSNLPNVEIGQELAQPGTAEATNAQAMKDVPREAVEEHKPPSEDQVHSSRTSNHSDGSNASFSSFAFPILSGEGRSGSVRAEPQSQRLEWPQKPSERIDTPKAAPAATGRKWFTCLFCCPSCH